MARHPVGARAQEAATTKQDSTAPPAAMPGGAGGMPEAVNPYASQASTAGRPQIQPDEFMVTDGPRDGNGSIRYNSDGYMVGLKPGKIVSAASHNLDGMRKQGITLSPMPKEVPVEDDEMQALGEASAEAAATT